MKRRDFVLKSSLASLGIASSTSLLGNINLFKGANDKVNIGVIGTGSRGSGLIPIINGIENLNVVACSDILPFRLEEGLARVEGKVKGYSDYRRLLDNKDVDAVLVATPFSSHAEIEIDALDAGKHIYGEKTMTKGYEDTRNVLSKATASDQIFQTGHQYHSSRLYTHVVDMIKSGKIGKIAAFECQWNRNGNWRRPVPSPDLERLINWRMYREYSGGLVAELCGHQIDFVNWVLGSTPEQVMGTGGVDYYKDGRETYDNVHLIYDYPEGVKAKFTCLTSNAREGYQIKVMGDKGTIILGPLKAWFYPEGIQEKELGVVDGVSGATIRWEEGKGIPIEVQHQDPSRQALVDFRDNVQNKKIPESDVVSGAKASIAVQMALDAMTENKIVQWKTNCDDLLRKVHA